MRKLHISTLILAFFICSLAMAENPPEKNIVKLQRDLNSSNSQIICDAALTLGELKDHDSIALLADLVDREDPTIRKCGIQALGLYGDNAFCQDFHTIWQSDAERSVRQSAGVAIILNDCARYIKREAKYPMDSNTCGYTQFFINQVKQSISKASPAADWREEIGKMDIKQTIAEKDTPEEIIQMRLHLVFGVMDWGESVSKVRSFEDQGNFEKTRWRYVNEIEEYMLKEEYLRQFCPLIDFPDFFFWESVLISKSRVDQDKKN